jgi:hypothetical protein
MEERSPRYRILSFETGTADDKRQWFSLEIQLHTSRSKIFVSPVQISQVAHPVRRVPRVFGTSAL